MDKETLYQYQSLNRELEELMERYSTIINTYHSPATSSTGSGGTPSNPTEKAELRLTELEGEYLKMINNVIDKQASIMRWLNKIDDSDFRAIVRYHFFNGLSWAETSKKVWNYEDSQSSRVYFNRRFKYYRNV